MKQISYYFSVLSPFSYLAGNRLEKMAKANNASIIYKPMDIMTLFKHTGGLPPKDRHKSRQAYRIMDLERVRIVNKLPLNLKPKFWPANPVPASCAIISATKDEGNIGDLVHSILACCWAEDKDIAEPKIVQECLFRAGFNNIDMKKNQKQSEDIFHANTQSAIQSNVFGAPTYVIDDQIFWGQDRLGHLEAYLKGELTS